MAELTPRQLFTTTFELLEGLDYSDEAKAIAWAIEITLGTDCKGINEIIDEVKEYANAEHESKYSKLKTLYQIACKAAKLHPRTPGVEVTTITFEEWVQLRDKVKEKANTEWPNISTYELCGRLAANMNYAKLTIYQAFISKKLPSNNIITAFKLYLAENDETSVQSVGESSID
jgi:hypothetical protein